MWREEVIIALLMVVVVILLLILHCIRMLVRQSLDHSFLIKQPIEVMAKEGNKSKDEKRMVDYVEDVLFVVTKEFIMLSDGTRVFLKSVVYFTNTQNNIEVKLQNNSTKTTKVSFEELQRVLPPNFVQCNEKQIVNKQFVDLVEKENIYLSTNDKLTMALTYRSFFN